MTTDTEGRSHTATAFSSDSPQLRPMAVFATIAVLSGWVLLTVPIATGLPLAPFVLAVNFLALVLPALVLTAREGGRSGVGRLLRDAVRLPVAWWWIPGAALIIPVAVWAAGAVLGVAQLLTPALALGVFVQFLSSALIINIWEELAWTGFFQRRAMSRWGVLGGSAVTALLFAAIHLPLAFAGGSVAVGIAVLLGTGIGLRLLIAGVDRWSGRSILTIGLLHGSFNATSGLLEPGSDWLRLVLTILLGVGAAVALIRTDTRSAGR